MAAQDIPRISPQEAHEHLGRGDARLICAYADEDKCRKLHLEGAVSLSEFEKQVDSVPNEAELIFY